MNKFGKVRNLNVKEGNEEAWEFQIFLVFYFNLFMSLVYLVYSVK